MPLCHLHPPLMPLHHLHPPSPPQTSVHTQTIHKNALLLFASPFTVCTPPDFSSHTDDFYESSVVICIPLSHPFTVCTPHSPLDFTSLHRQFTDNSLELSVVIFAPSSPQTSLHTQTIVCYHLYFSPIHHNVSYKWHYTIRGSNHLILTSGLVSYFSPILHVTLKSSDEHAGALLLLTSIFAISHIPHKYTLCSLANSNLYSSLHTREVLGLNLSPSKVYTRPVSMPLWWYTAILPQLLVPTYSATW